ncbi:MAG: hypothetical protein QM758_04270 [Armatimonas sp.]
MPTREDAGEERKARLRADLRIAMKERRTIEAGVLRALIAALDNAEAPPAPAGQTGAVSQDFHSGAAEIERLWLSQAQVQALLLAEIQERESVAAELERLGHSDRAEALRTEAQLVRRYLD